MLALCLGISVLQVLYEREREPFTSTPTQASSPPPLAPKEGST